MEEVKNYTDDWKKAIFKYHQDNNISACCSLLDVIVFTPAGEKNQIIPITDYIKLRNITLV